MESTAIRVSRKTARKLSSLQRSLKITSLDETIDFLVKHYREELIRQAFGADRGKIKPFSEEDRGEVNH